MTASDALFDLGSPAATRSALDGWIAALDAATSATAVMVLVNGFVAQWEEEEIATLPEGCRPWRIIDATDVHFLKHLLASRPPDASEDPLLGCMGSFFHAASRRLCELRAREN